MSPLKLRADIPEPYAPDTRAGQEVILSIDAMPGRTFRGRVARISPSMDEKTRSLTIEALIDNKDGALKPGLFAHVKVVSQNNTQVLMIPAKALVTFAGINKAYAIEGDHAVERQLKLGARTGDLIEVVAGLKAGDQVALNNLDRLANGTLVSVKNRATPAE
jgi:membrane fusion protein (multidrug efflux system)